MRGEILYAWVTQRTAGSWKLICILKHYSCRESKHEKKCCTTCRNCLCSYLSLLLPRWTPFPVLTYCSTCNGAKWKAVARSLHMNVLVGYLFHLMDVMHFCIKKKNTTPVVIPTWVDTTWEIDVRYKASSLWCKSSKSKHGLCHCSAQVQKCPGTDTPAAPRVLLMLQDLKSMGNCLPSLMRHNGIYVS